MYIVEWFLMVIVATLKIDRAAVTKANQLSGGAVPQ
jgi:hypothetical protein